MEIYQFIGYGIFALIVLWIFKDKLTFSGKFLGFDISTKQSAYSTKKHCINLLDMDMMVMFYTNIYGLDCADILENHLKTNTKEMLERSLDLNHIPWGKEQRYAYYIEDTGVYLDSHLQRKLESLKIRKIDLTTPQIEELHRIIIKILERNK